MANYANLKSDIAGVIRTNNNEEITGDILQEQLLGMVDSLGAGFQYKGVATPTTAPGTPDENVFYIASTAGTYTNFGGLAVAEGEVAILKYNGSWAKEVTGAATAAQVTQLGQEVKDIFKKADSDEYIDAVLDADGRIIEATKPDGTKYIQKLESPDLPDYHEQDAADFIDAVVDANNRLLAGFKKDGTLFAQKIVSPYIGGALKPYAGKKWVVLGDSFTAGDTQTLDVLDSGKYAGMPANYAYLIGNRTEMDIVSFFGGGRTLAYPAVPGDFVNSVTCPSRTFYYQNIPADADFITIYLGINDEHHAPGSGGGDGEDNTGEIPLGNASDNTTATYYGAWNVVLTWLRTNRPFAHIGIIVSNGCPDTYATATKAMAKKYGYPTLNLNGDERTPAMIRSSNPDMPYEIRDLITQAQAVDYDGTQTGEQNWHPNTAAHLFESFFIEEFLKTI